MSRQSVGKVLGIRDAGDLLFWEMSQEPSRKCDGRRVRLQMSRRNIDDQTLAIAVGNVFETLSN